MLTFMPSDEGTQRMCFNVSIIDDLLGNEPDEEFSVIISSIIPAGRVAGDINNTEACITIIDNDSEYKHIILLRSASTFMFILDPYMPE